MYSDVCIQTINLANEKCSIKGNYDISWNTKKYFFSGCRGYENIELNLAVGDKWFCSEQEAQTAGFIKSAACGDKDFRIN
ncbi:hypothetical protein HY310_03665 [Candidatus Microgenomates bacterium]|nr:hypothetical protein [Candidatus Microgenomates bacterium]